MPNQAFYRTGIFGNFFFGGGNFAFSKREFPVALFWLRSIINNHSFPMLYAEHGRSLVSLDECRLSVCTLAVAVACASCVVSGSSGCVARCVRDHR